jgi:glycosyltransferase involved in cell wall biosynthesis
MQRPKIIYIAPALSSFVKKDIAFLSETFLVLTPVHNWTKKTLVPITLLKQFCYLLWQMPRSKVVFIMFGGYWSLLPAMLGRLFRRPVYIIPGGTDCVSFPSLGYGSLRKAPLRTTIKWSYSLCTRILPVDETLVFCEYSYLQKRDYDFQGYRYFFPHIKTGYTVVHNGFEENQFAYDKASKIRGTFITIASADDMRRFTVKGIDTVLKIAPRFPDCIFRVIGVSEGLREKIQEVPGNVFLLPFMEPAEFRELIAVSEFCLQLSVSEGFPNALCEAMLGGCIPFVSSVGAMPMIVGETGFVATSSELEYLVRELTGAIATSDDVKQKMAAGARARITENFPLGKRKRALLGFAGGQIFA